MDTGSTNSAHDLGAKREMVLWGSRSLLPGTTPLASGIPIPYSDGGMLRVEVGGLMPFPLDR